MRSNSKIEFDHLRGSPNNGLPFFYMRDLTWMISLYSIDIKIVLSSSIVICTKEG